MGGGESMYVKLLSDSLEDWTEELSPEELVDYALACRREIPETPSVQRDTVYGLLGAEVAYDRVLIKLCAAMNFECVVVNFAFPKQERRRVEAELAVRGVDLAVLSRTRQP